MSHLHTFSAPVEGEPHARQCADCGERQTFRPPTGKGVEFSDVLVDAADLRALIRAYRGIVSDYDYYDPDTADLCDRLTLLLPET